MPVKVNIEVTESPDPVGEMAGAGKCKKVKVGQKWKYPDDVSGICPFALNALLPALMILQFGGVHPQSRHLGDDDKVIECCPDAFRPVVFTMTRFNED